MERNLVLQSCTAISLYGELTLSNNGAQQVDSVTYSISLDGTPTTNYGSFFSSPSDYANNILASFANLTYGLHTIELVMHNPEQVSDGSVLLQFDRAVLTSGVPPAFWDEATSGSSEISPTTSLFPDDGISFRGQWSFEPDLLPGHNDTFHTSKNVGDRALLSFNGTAISISGLTTTVSGSYNITLNGDAPVTLSAKSSFNVTTPTVLYYRTGLDPSVMHQLGIVNVGAPNDENSGFFAMGSVDVTAVGGDTGTTMSSSHLSRGAIAGIAVAASVAFLAIIALVIHCARRRRRAHRRKEELIVNPRLGPMRRLSFLARSIRSGRSGRSVHSAEGEKDIHFSSKAHDRMEGGVLDIRASKDIEEYVDDIEVARGIQEVTQVRHASKNSDGSFSIDLPELPQKGHVHGRSSQSQPASPVPSPRRGSPVSSPPTKPRGPRSMHSSLPIHQRDSSRGMLLAELYRAAVEESEPEPDGAAATRERRESDHLSPLRVNFEDEPYETTLQRREGRHASAGAVSLPQSLRLALSFGHVPNYDTMPAVPNVTVTHSTPVTPITPITPISPVVFASQDPHLSFLDLDSSASASLRSDARSTRQSRSNSTRSSSKSRYDNITVDYASLPLDHRISLGLSMAIGGGPTSSRPSLSPNISLQPISLPSSSSPQVPTSGIPEDASSPLDPEANTQTLDFLPSPTESIPYTVSDIHFRHSSYSTIDLSSESRRASANRLSGIQRSPHPPLPGSPTAAQAEPKPFIVQKLLGMAPAGSGPSTPYSSPITPGFGTAGPSRGDAGQSPTNATFTPPASAQSFRMQPR
ncbi:unnamed protein product [Somion occarium]|uniref:Uncharacterized protein n=1 Tax=Somion occarium TaxID=3059160 RepID=A0ABP1DGY1_9APHY